MAVRYGRWMARGAALTMAGLMFAAIERREAILLPGMTEPYEVAAIDPYLAGAMTYIIVVRVLFMLMARFQGAAQRHLANLRGR